MFVFHLSRSCVLFWSRPVHLYQQEWHRWHMGEFTFVMRRGCLLFADKRNLHCTSEWLHCTLTADRPLVSLSSLPLHCTLHARSLAPALAPPLTAYRELVSGLFRFPSWDLILEKALDGSEWRKRRNHSIQLGLCHELFIWCFVNLKYIFFDFRKSFCHQTN